MTSMADRRQFLRQAALAGGWVASLGQAAEPERDRSARGTITFGFSLYGMRSLPLAKALATCARIGYDAVELAVMPDWPADPKRLSKDDRRQLRSQLQSLKLALPALMENTPLDGEAETHRKHLDRLQAAADLGHELSPEAPPVLETILGGRPELWDKLKKQFADRLRDWARLAERVRTTIAIKPHRFGALNSPEQAIWLLREVGSRRVRLAYDYSHFQHRDMPLAATIQTLLPHTVFIHVKDTKIDQGKAQFVLPGEGTTDYAELLRLVKAAGYKGCVCVEVSGMVSGKKDYDPEAAARRCHEKLAPIFTQVGLRSRPGM